MPKLVITDGDGVRELPLTGEAKAGRLADNAIQLKVAEASRNHCRFFQDKNAWYVEDLGSSNGTLVNGRRVSRFELQDGDVISIGAASMKFMEFDAPAAPAVEGWGDDDEISLEQETFLLLGIAGREGEVLKLSGDRVGVGRTKKNLLCIPDASVSGEHAEIVKRGDAWFVRDLMSSNGTFVEGERVKEQELRSGQVVRFGLAEARFCVGKPKDFSPPAGRAEETRAKTTIMQIPEGVALDDASFEVHEEAARATKGGAGSVVALLLLLGLGGGAVYYYFQAASAAQTGGATQTPGRRQTSNLVSEAWWSFEPQADVEAKGGWRKDDPLDRASFDDAASDARTGAACFLISRGEAGPPSFAVLDAGVETDFTTSAGAWYRVAAAVRLSGADVQGGPAVFWYGPPGEGETEPRLLARDVVAAPLADGWSDVEGFVQAPDGAMKARLGLAAAGLGDVSFDDVVLETADASRGAGFESKNFKAVFSNYGAVRLARFGRPILDGAGVWRFPPGGEPEEAWTAFAPRGAAEGARRTGSLRGKVDVAASFEKREDGFRTTWTFGGPAPEYFAALPLSTSLQDLNVTVFEGRKATRFRTPFVDQNADAVMVGERGDRARLDFVDGDGKPAAAKVSVVAKGGRVVLKLDRGPGQGVGFDVRLSFDAEQKEAQELLRKAAEALRAGKDGEAIAVYDDVLARFAFDETIEREAAQRRERTLSDAQKRLRELTARVDDALFFLTARRDDALAKDLAAEAARFDGPEAGGAVRALATRFEEARTKSARERAEDDARIAFLRGQDYLANVARRRETAAAFFESVARRYPETEWGKQAAQLVETLKNK
jgi:pSer/pThr/pTyr-binding forkhead associated (FHA) protein